MTSVCAAMSFFRSKGLPDLQAAAIVGNLQRESGLDPQAYNPGEGAHGIAQWRGQRWSSALAYAQQTGRNVYSLDLQLDFVWRELQSVPDFGFAQLLQATTVEDAVVAFQDNFERCGECVTSDRIAFARLALFGCERVTPPARGGGIGSLAALGALALSAAAGLAAFAGRRRRQEPEPEPVPPWA